VKIPIDAARATGVHEPLQMPGPRDAAQEPGVAGLALGRRPACAVGTSGSNRNSTARACLRLPVPANLLRAANA
jgi:hypothetical protein